MTITTTQKIIRIGDSKGAIYSARDLKRLGLDVGDEIEITFKKKHGGNASDEAVLKTAKSILERYKKDFENLAER